jgi:hypothetical protein
MKYLQRGAAAWQFTWVACFTEPIRGHRWQ